MYEQYFWKGKGGSNPTMASQEKLQEFEGQEFQGEEKTRALRKLRRKKIKIEWKKKKKEKELKENTS